MFFKIFHSVAHFILHQLTLAQARCLHFFYSLFFVGNINSRIIGPNIGSIFALEAFGN